MQTLQYFAHILMIFLYQNFKKSNSRYFLTLMLASIVLVLATGCDQAREKIAALIKPQTVEDVTAAVNEKIEKRKFKEAQTEGEEFLRGKEDVSGHLAWEIAKACAQIGEYDLAIKYVGQAVKANAVTGPQGMTEPLLEPVRTDIRFVSMLVGIGDSENSAVKSNTSSLPQESQESEQKKSSTSIRMDAQGTEVRAGDIVIKLPN